MEYLTGSVPVIVAARVYGKDASWVRAGIIGGWLPIGTATYSGSVVKTKIYDFYNELIWLISYRILGEKYVRLPRSIYAKPRMATALPGNSIQPVSDN